MKLERILRRMLVIVAIVGLAAGIAALRLAERILPTCCVRWQPSRSRSVSQFRSRRISEPGEWASTRSR